MARFVTWEPFWDAMTAAGLVPDGTRRFVIDAEVGKPCRIYYDTFADERLLTVGPEAFVATDNESDAFVK